MRRSAAAVTAGPCSTVQPAGWSASIGTPTRSRAARRWRAEPPAFTMVQRALRPLPAALAVVGVTGVDGIVFDLGVSSFQLDRRERGFSFQADGPLDMRMAQNGPTAADLVMGSRRPSWPACCTALRRRAAGAARSHAPIVETRRTRRSRSTGELARPCRPCQGRQAGPRDPATRTFQALRMIVNDELGELERGLEAAETAVAGGGRLVVVSFHSGEDTQVKRFVNRPGRPPGPAVTAPAARRDAGGSVALGPARRDQAERCRDRCQPARTVGPAAGGRAPTGIGPIGCAPW